MTIAVVYDASALLAYAHGQIAAAELISEINAEGRQVGVPSTCLTVALAALTDEWDITQLIRLMSTRTMVLLPLGKEADDDPAQHLRQVSEFTRLADGDLNVGHAVPTIVQRTPVEVSAADAGGAARKPRRREGSATAQAARDRCMGVTPRRDVGAPSAERSDHLRRRRRRSSQPVN